MMRPVSEKPPLDDWILWKLLTAMVWIQNKTGIPKWWILSRSGMMIPTFMVFDELGHGGKFLLVAVLFFTVSIAYWIRSVGGEKRDQEWANEHHVPIFNPAWDWIFVRLAGWLLAGIFFVLPWHHQSIRITSCLIQAFLLYLLSLHTWPMQGPGFKDRVKAGWKKLTVRTMPVPQETPA